MSNTSKHLFIGLPESGKTTFLAAFWYYVRNGVGRDGLYADTLPKEREYLNAISDVWMRGESQKHTATGAIIDISLMLRDVPTGKQSEFRVPDISGELFLNHWSHRSWSNSFQKLAAEANGILLFVHPNCLAGPLTIAEVNAAEAALGDGFDADAVNPNCGIGEQHVGLSEYREFDALRVPPQVILVDQLQCLLGPPCNHPKLKLSVIVSAWDLVDRQEMNPFDWLQRQAPLLFQFIKANHRRIDARAFGISAQGGNYTDDNERRQLLMLSNPVDRIKVYDGVAVSNDLTRVVRWML